MQGNFFQGIKAREKTGGRQKKAKKAGS